jgi:hypothetical protein
MDNIQIKYNIKDAVSAAKVIHITSKEMGK